MNPIMKLKTEKSPRETIYKHFEQVLPIKGGWGYSKDDAVIIDSNDASINKSEVFNGIKYEYKFIEKRLFEEMIVTRSLEEGYAGIVWNLISQELIHDDGKYYDRIIVDVSALLYIDWLKLKEEWENNYYNPSFNKREHEHKKQEKTYKFEREFWFEISSFLGKYDGVIIQNQETGEDEIAEIKFKKDFLTNLSYNTKNKEKTSHQEIDNINPIEIKFGYKIFLNEGVYYIYCAEQDTLNSMIGIDQVYAFIEQKSRPCNGVPIKKIDFYEIYNFEDKYQIYNPENKYENELNTLEEACLEVQDLSEKRLKIKDAIQREKQRYIESQKADPAIVFLFSAFLFVSAIYGILRYFYAIPNGAYLAQTIKINDKVIGQGTQASHKYNFVLDDDKVLVKDIPYIYNSKKSNLIKNRYTNALDNNEELVITFLGNVKIYDLEHKYFKEIKVLY